MFFLAAPHIISRVGESPDLFHPERELTRLTDNARLAAAENARRMAPLRRVA